MRKLLDFPTVQAKKWLKRIIIIIDHRRDNYKDRHSKQR